MFIKPALIFILSLWIIPVTSVFPAMLPKDITISEINKLDTLFKDLSSEIYKKSALKTNSTYMKIKDIKFLHKTALELATQNKHIEAISLIKRNNNLIQKNIDDTSVFFLINLLLTHNEWATANNLYKFIKKEGDKSLISNVRFIFSKYYFNRNKWAKTLEFLDGIFEDLSDDDGHYALIMNGIVLQNLKKHRGALKYHEKVPSTSIYYQYAQLNIAIVYIRQGWWSDAHIVITNLVKTIASTAQDKKEFINRLYLVLGYSFLQQEYFREARESFRNIKKDSIYANRAMLGISLAAASQGDNVGSLNILNILQQKNPYALSVEETYLLQPYVYEKLGQHKTASASYSIALAYYQKRIHEINSIIKNINQTNPYEGPIHLSNIKNNTLLIENNKIDLSQRHLIFFINNMRELKQFKSNIINTRLLKNITNLSNKYNVVLKNIIITALKKRAGYLQSYQNQSQYGLARLYDNSKSN